MFTILKKIKFICFLWSSQSPLDSFMWWIYYPNPRAHSPKKKRGIQAVKKNPFWDRTENFIHGFQSAERHGRKIETEIAVVSRGFFCDSRQFRWNVYFFFSFVQKRERMENSGDCFVNERTKRVEKKILTSIMRITVEFRFVEHCSGPSKSPIVDDCCVSFFFGTQKKERTNENWIFLLPAVRSIATTFYRSFCSRIQFIDIDMIHQWSSVIFFLLFHDGLFRFLGKQ